MQDLLTIGRFARLSRLSIRQLRNYDDQGLLAPARVDPETGYRLYHRGQARTAATIAMLRELDVPLEVISELMVADDESVTSLLAAERRRRRAELERAERAVIALAALEHDGLPDVDVEVRSLAPRQLAVFTAGTAAEHVAARTARWPMI